MPLPRNLTQPVGFGAVVTNDDARDTFLVQQMHALADAIYQARNRGDKADAANLLVRFRALMEEYRARGGSNLGPFDNFVNAVGQWIEQSVDAIPSAIAALPNAIGAGVFRSVVPFALMYLGYLWLTSPRRRF